MDSRFCSSRMDVLVLARLRAVAQIVHEEADQTADHGDVAKPLQWTLPELYRPGDMRIFRQAAVNLRLRSVMQHVNNAGATDAWRIVHASVRKVGMILELLGALVREVQHVVLAAEVQTSRGARLDARRFESFADAIRTQRAFENAIVLRVHLRNVERASGDAVAAPDAIGLLKIHDAVRILHDGPVRGTRSQAPRLR